MSSSRHSALASLNAYADDTDSEPEDEVDAKCLEIPESTATPSPADGSRDAQSVSCAVELKPENPNPLGLSYQDDWIDDDVVDDFNRERGNVEESSAEEVDSSGIVSTPVDSDVTEDSAAADDQPQIKKVKLPPEPTEECPRELQDRFTGIFERISKTGFSMNQHIQANKQFRNPSIYEKLILRCNIDELGTNYPKDIYDPYVWDETSHYDQLEKARVADLERKENEKKEKTAEIIAGIVKKATAPVTVNSSGAPTQSEPKRKPKDQKGAMPVFGRRSRTNVTFEM